MRIEIHLEQALPSSRIVSSDTIFLTLFGDGYHSQGEKSRSHALNLDIVLICARVAH
jgi:hypothetical protein